MKKAFKMKEAIKKVAKKVCTNCTDSGMTCIVCGVGKTQE